MTTIFERVKTALDTLSPAIPYSLAPYKNASLPATYIAYQLITSEPEQNADDAETQRSYLVQISIYSTAGLISLPDVDTAMLAAGFQKSSYRQVPYDQSTGHYGIAKDFIYIE